MGLAFEAGVGHRGREELDGPYGVVVARYDVIDFIRVAVGVDYGDDLYAEPLGFLDGDGLFL